VAKTHALESLIGKLPRSKKITYKKIQSFSDNDLTYEKIEFFSEGEPIRAYFVRTFIGTSSE
jgi:hypothetical protein